MPLRLLLAACCGLAIRLAFPGVDLWPLAVVGMAGLTITWWEIGPWRGALLGLVAGLSYLLPLLAWSGTYVGALPWIALATLEALYVAAVGAVAGYLQTHRVHPVAVALAWIAGELARATTPFGGFPWGRLALSQADSPLLGVVSIAGTPGLSFLVALTGALLAYAAHAALRSTGPVAMGTGWRARGGAIRPVAAVAAAAACLFGPLAIPRPVDGPTVKVLAIQGNVPAPGLDFNAQRRAVLDLHAGATLSAAKDIAAGRLPQPDVVLWPENSSDIDPFRNPDAQAVIQGAVDAVDAPVVVGAVLRSDDDRNANAALLYEPGKGVVARYLKQRPVPFAEYIPYRDFFRTFSDKVDLVSRDFLAGDRIGVLPVPVQGGTLPLGVAICFEVVVDDLMRDTVLTGAQVILVPTNNATFGYTDESVQQLAVSRVKAVELGRSVVHVSTVGVSALITPDGQAHQRTQLFTQARLFGELPRRTELTWAVRLGPWPERAGVAALAMLVAYQPLRRRRLGSAGTATTTRNGPLHR